MTIPGWLIAVGLFLLKLFTRGKGNRVNVEIRSEAAIDAERKRLDNLRQRAQVKKEALDAKTKAIVEAKTHGLLALANQLDDDRSVLYADYNRARDDYINAGGRADEIR